MAINKLIYVALALAPITLAGCGEITPIEPTGLWLVTTKFPGGRTVVSTCHSENQGRKVVCDPPLPFRPPKR